MTSHTEHSKASERGVCDHSPSTTPACHVDIHEIHLHPSKDVSECTSQKAPIWMVLIQSVAALVGLWLLFSYWHGSHGILDRGGWKELQAIADTRSDFSRDAP